MLAEKLENIGERARELLGDVSPATWQALRQVPGQMAIAANLARELESGEDGDLSLHLMLVGITAPLRELGGFVESASFEKISPIIDDLEDLLPLAETLDKGPLFLGGDMARKTPTTTA